LLQVDIRDEHISAGEHGSIETTATVAAPQPNRWYYGWLVKDAAGTVGFELRLDDAGPPDAPWRRVVTAVRTDHGANANPRYRQTGSRVWFDRDYELIRAGSSGGDWIIKGFTPETAAADGDASLVPRDLAALWFARAGAMREEGTGVGLASVDLGMPPGGTGSYSATVRGLANVESTGAVHAQDELPVHVRLGEGTYAVRTGSDSRVDLAITGFQLVGGTDTGGWIVIEGSGTEVAVDIRDVHVAHGRYGSIDTTASLPAPAANRWYYGWLWLAEDGTPGFELLLDDAPAPDRPHRRVVTAIRTGPGASILPRYRQIGDRVSYDDDIPVLARRHGTREWLEQALRATDEGAYGSAVLIPREIASLWYSRGQVMRASGLGVGIGQITMGAIPTTGAGAYATQIKGFADTEDTGTGHGQDEVPVHHQLGLGTFGHYLNETVSVDIFLTGFRLASGPSVMIETDLDSGVLLHVDLEDAQVACGRFATWHETITLGSATPERWHYGWVWAAEDGSVGFEVRLDDAGPPAQPYRRVVTAFQVDRNGNILPRFRQLGARVSFDGDYTKAEYTHHAGGAWNETAFDQMDTHFGSMSFIPRDLTTLWYTRTEVVNAPEHGRGLAEIAFGMTPTDEGSYSTSIRGYADTEPPGSVFVNDELPVHHQPGRGTFSYRMSDRTLASILYAGFEIMGAPRGGGGTCPAPGLPPMSDGGVLGVDGGGPVAGSDAGPGGGRAPRPAVDEGCGCVVPGRANGAAAPAPVLGWLALIVLLAGRGRRRR
jgi:hypothetical protein